MIAGQRWFLTLHCELSIVLTTSHPDTSMSVHQPVHFWMTPASKSRDREKHTKSYQMLKKSVWVPSQLIPESQCRTPNSSFPPKCWRLFRDQILAWMGRAGVSRKVVPWKCHHRFIPKITLFYLQIIMSVPCSHLCSQTGTCKSSQTLYTPILTAPRKDLPLVYMVIALLKTGWEPSCGHSSIEDFAEEVGAEKVE